MSIYSEENMTNLKALQELEDIYETMYPASQNNEDAFVWFTGIPNPLFNVVMHLKADVDLEDKVDKLISEVPGNAPVSFFVHKLNDSTSLAEVLEERGFKSAINCTVMSWDVAPIARGSHRIEQAESNIFQNILGITFGLNDFEKVENSKLLENAKAENYIVYLEGVPVGTGTIISKGDIGGIFMIATLSEYQKNGCGRSMMQFLMNRASELNLKRLLLLSSPAGLKLYSDLGFVKNLDVELYTGST